MAEKARPGWVYAGVLGKRPDQAIVKSVTAAFFRRLSPRVTYPLGSSIPNPNPEMVPYLGLPGALLFRIQEGQPCLFLRDVSPLGPNEHQAQGIINFLGVNVSVKDIRVGQHVENLCCRAGVIRRK